MNDSDLEKYNIIKSAITGQHTTTTMTDDDYQQKIINIKNIYATPVRSAIISITRIYRGSIEFVITTSS